MQSYAICHVEICEADKYTESPKLHLKYLILQVGLRTLGYLIYSTIFIDMITIYDLLTYGTGL